ncbi:hypothetical protein [Perlabentimonas gracilis]|jgi:hypothetical protein|uniref:hypothetical protein n=1 Tax=Perlabentimonas gracilis TaxID=2715279 RepID=UPI001407B4FA|nr:hypothetical protein [Perlabentimonas gracilis]NHB68729.1 hypothetical protein [Perlabentimonas gracilis]
MLSKLKKQHFKNKEVTWLAIFAIIMIPLGTYLFGTKESPFYYTLSMIGNRLGYRLNFIIWGIVTGLLLTFFIIRLFVLKSFHNQRARRLLVWALVFLLLTVLIPSLERLPVLMIFHILVAAGFAISLTLSLYLFIKHLSISDQKVYRWSILMFYLVVGGSLLMLFVFGMNGIFELFFFISLSIFLGALNRKLFKNRG